MHGTRGLLFKYLPVALAVVPPVLPSQCAGDGHPGHGTSGGVNATGGMGPAGGSTMLAGGTGAGNGGSSASNTGGSSSDASVAGGTAATGGATGSSSGSTSVCTGACSVHVNPAAPTNGSGSDWSDPSNDLQGAINAQATRGGGEVWVLSGDYALSTVSRGNAITVGSSVTLRGGFVGNETASAQRPAGQQTRLHGAGAGSSTAGLTIASAEGVVIDALGLIDADPNFAITNSTNVLLTGLTTSTNAQSPTTHSLVIADSAVDIENSAISMPRNSNGLALTNSDVAIKNSSVDAPPYPDGASLGGIPVLVANGGRLLLQNSSSNSGTSIGSGAVALIVRSTLNTGTSALGPSLSVRGTAALVDNHIGPGFGYPPVYTTGSLLVFDSSFGGTRTTNAHGYFPSAWAIDGSGSLEVSLSTFGAGYCDYADANCAVVIPGNINNSRFASDNVVVRQSTPPSNCVAGADAGVCTDAGDESLLAASHARLMTFAAPFLNAPFNADLSGYSNPEFWRCTDTNAPDPGYHAPCSP